MTLYICETGRQLYGKLTKKFYNAQVPIKTRA